MSDTLLDFLLLLLLFRLLLYFSNTTKRDQKPATGGMIIASSLFVYLIETVLYSLHWTIDFVSIVSQTI